MELASELPTTTAYNLALSDWLHALEIHRIEQKKGDWWEFASRAEGQTITAEARDLPGSVTKLVLEA